MEQPEGKSPYERARSMILQCGDGSSGLFFPGLKLTRLPPEIGNLVNLESLDLAGHHLQELPPEIGKLRNLQMVDLSGNQLTKLPDAFSQLQRVERLFLLRNRFVSFPQAVCDLQSLVELNLWGNQIVNLPQEIVHLSHLNILNLANNDLESLPHSLMNWQKLRELYLHGNCRLGLANEILGPTSGAVFRHKEQPGSPTEIFDFYFRPRTAPLLEARVMIIGDPAVGKSSLSKRLVWNLPPNPQEDSTVDVSLERWKLQVQSEFIDIALWDFGGQEALHTAHPLFFTSERTLYLVVLSAREKKPEERAEYWLKMVERYGSGSRALVVVNRTDEHPMDLDRRDLWAKYKDVLPETLSQGFYGTSCKTGYGIHELETAIARELSEMSQVWTTIPEEWSRVKSQLSLTSWGSKGDGEASEDTLTFDEWRALCRRNGITKLEDQDSLLRLMMNLGLVVAFPDEARLNGLGVLNPQWLTKAIYTVLVHDTIATRNGLLELSDLSVLLPADRYPKYRHVWLMDVLEKCELAFSSDRETFIVPSRLPKETPEWASHPKWKAEGSLQVQIRFNVLPERVISRFIVRTFRKSTGKTWWRHGISFRQGPCEALVQLDLANSLVSISILGPTGDRKQLIATISDSLQDISRGDAGELWVLLDGVHAERFSDLMILARSGERAIRRVVADKALDFDLVAALDLITFKDEEAGRQVFINMSTNDDHSRIIAISSNVNYRSKLTETANTITAVQPVTAEIGAIKALLAQLMTDLESVPEAQSKVGELVANRAGELAKLLDTPEPMENKSLVEDVALGLKGLCKNLVGVAPGVVVTISNIYDAIKNLIG